jgi:hypothetical protein
MTIDERFERSEHLTVGVAEERRKDREEYKALWRDTRRHINEFAVGMLDLRRNVAELAVETRMRIDELADRIQQNAEESRDANKRLEVRIESLVSAIGQFIGQRPQ